MSLAAALLAVAIAVGAAADAVAADIRVYAAGAVQHAIVALAQPFRERTGHTLVTSFDTVGALRDRVIAGESPDVVILSAPALATLVERGRLVETSRREIGRTGVGLAVKLDAPPADISSPEKLRAALLAAPSIAYADPARGATAGTHFRGVLDRLGIASQVERRTSVLPFGGAVVAAVGQGQFALGASQTTEILADARVRLLGELPGDLQQWTTYGAAAVLAADGPTAAFLDFLTGPEGVVAFERIGFKR